MPISFTIERPSQYSNPYSGEGYLRGDYNGPVAFEMVHATRKATDIVISPVWYQGSLTTHSVHHRQRIPMQILTECIIFFTFFHPYLRLLHSNFFCYGYGSENLTRNLDANHRGRLILIKVRGKRGPSVYIQIIYSLNPFVQLPTITANETA